MASIRQNSSPSRLPNFRNLGVWLRVLLITNAFAALIVLAVNRLWFELPEELLLAAAAVEPPLLASLLLLHALQRQLARLPYAAGAALMVGCVLAITAAIHASGISPVAFGVDLPRVLLWTGLCALALLYYFNIRARLQSPALAEARLLALTARIRPHFLFNALNAILGVIRSEPQRAEAALEELADLFRVLMRDNRELVRLSDEIALARQYLGLERLRLGERLQVKWDIESCPPDALLPPLMLQPLLENAVYHGIEPAEQPGQITIGFARRGEQLLIEIANPFDAGVPLHAGNQMALDNIRERLMLFYDLEARLETEIDSGAGSGTGRYVVRIIVPYRPGSLR
ncbi:MAG: histidine kinase [Proteobacteria bacterium]|nr:histidine kinase [Pseudomonadota bacterium]